MSNADSYHDTDRLAELLRCRHQCLLELRQLGRRQQELIDQGQMTALLDLLTIKQRSIGRLQQIERALDPFRDQAPQQRCWRNAEHRQQCAELVEQCQRLLAEIIAAEKQSETVLLRRRQQTLDQLQQMQAAEDVLGMYATQSELAGGQLNILSEG